LHHAVVTRRIAEGMAPAGPYQNVARAQLFFIDACRSTPEVFGEHKLPEVGDIWDIYRAEAGCLDDRRNATFYATMSGLPSYGRIGKQTVFSEALLACLNGKAGIQAGAPDPATGEATWCVTSHSLHARLESQLRGSCQRYTTDDLGIGQTFTVNQLS